MWQYVCARPSLCSLCYTQQLVSASFVAFLCSLFLSLVIDRTCRDLVAISSPSESFLELGVVVLHRVERTRMAHLKVSSKNVLEASKHYDGGSSTDILKTVDKVIRYNDNKREAEKNKEIEERHMIRSNHQVTTHIALHKDDGTSQNFVMEVPASVQFQPLHKEIMTKCGRKKLRLSWIDRDGEIGELSHQTWRIHARNVVQSSLEDPCARR